VMTMRTVSSRRPSSEDQVRSLAGPKAALTLRTVLGTGGKLRADGSFSGIVRLFRQCSDAGMRVDACPARPALWPPWDIWNSTP
jgi:hypothetical protein